MALTQDGDLPGPPGRLWAVRGRSAFPLHPECCLPARSAWATSTESRFLGLTAPLQHERLAWGTLCPHLAATRNSSPRPNDTPVPPTKNPCVPWAPPAISHTAASAPCPERSGPGALPAPALSSLGRLLQEFLVSLSQTDHVPGSKTSSARRGTQSEPQGEAGALVPFVPFVSRPQRGIPCPGTCCLPGSRAGAGPRSPVSEPAVDVCSSGSAPLPEQEPVARPGPENAPWDLLAI